MDISPGRGNLCVSFSLGSGYVVHNFTSDYKLIVNGVEALPIGARKERERMERIARGERDPAAGCCGALGVVFDPFCRKSGFPLGRVFPVKM